MKSEVYKSGPPFIFRFRTNGKYAIDEISKSYIFFPERDALNDPFDSLPEAIKLTKNDNEIKRFHQVIVEAAQSPGLKDYIANQMSPTQIREFAQNKISVLINSFGIACFSMYFQNLPLWAGYANNHRGACLQYDTSYDKDFFDRLKPIKYVEELKEREFYPITDDQVIVDAFYEKSNVWGYEKEVRLIKETRGKIHHKKEALRNVILGYQVSKNFKKQVIRAVKKNYTHVSVFQMLKPNSINKYPLQELY